jgi:single-strand DNA-binding protein
MNPTPTVLIGNVTQEPELTFTANGQARLSFSMACNYVWYDQAGEKQEKVSYFNVVAWRYVAENAAKTLEKGIGAVVVGRLEQRSYETKEGEKRSTIELIADEIGVNTRSIEAVTRRRRAEDGSAAPSNGNARRNKPVTGRVPASVGADEEPF